MLRSMAPIVTDRVGSRMHYLSTLAGTPVGKQDRSPRPCPVRGPLSLTLSIAKCYIRPTFLPLITHSDFYAVEARHPLRRPLRPFAVARTGRWGAGSFLGHLGTSMPIEAR